MGSRGLHTMQTTVESGIAAIATQPKMLARDRTVLPT